MSVLAGKLASSGVADAVVNSFKDKEFVSKITPALTDIIRPFITAAINDAVVRAVKAVKKTLIAKLRTDQDALTKRVDAFESQRKALELQVKGKDVELENKQKLTNKLQLEIVSLCNQHDDLEQYG